MTNEINWAKRRERSSLKDVVPLNTPFSIQVEPIRACNLKCIYCVHSVKDLNSQERKVLNFGLFESVVNGLKSFDCKLKSLIFSGIGEPLLNPALASMVALAKSVSDNVVVITNGLLLNEEKTDELIGAGVDTIRVSLQGLDAKDYFSTCGAKIDFGKFLEKLKYLYDNKQLCEICLKMPDIVVSTDEKRKLLHELFGDKCDNLTIQDISPIQSEVDYSNIKANYDRTIYQEKILSSVKVCPQPFFSMQIMSDGLVRPCCILDTDSVVVGDVNRTSIYSIWNGKQMNELRRMHLQGKRENIKVCSRCTYPVYMDNEFDNIDNYAEMILDKLNK